MTSVSKLAYDHKHALECKHCLTASALRSHRRFFFEFIRTRLTGKVPFRCIRCNRRFWLRIDPRDL